MNEKKLLKMESRYGDENVIIDIESDCSIGRLVRHGCYGCTKTEENARCYPTDEYLFDIADEDIMLSFQQLIEITEFLRYLNEKVNNDTSGCPWAGGRKG